MENAFSLLSAAVRYDAGKLPKFNLLNRGLLSDLNFGGKQSVMFSYKLALA